MIERDRPLVTFALFTFNQERFVREAVEAALAQDYSPLEIVISDDCSTDGTFRVIEEIVNIYDGPHPVVTNKIISFLFTKDFAPMGDLMLYQLIGDVMKIASWLLGYIMWAKAMTRWFIFSEVVFSATFVALAIGATRMVGLQGATAAFLVNYCFYFIFLLWLFRRYFRAPEIVGERAQ